MVVRLSWWSFSSRVIRGLLSGFEDKGIVVEKGERIGGELIQLRIAKPERRLRFTRRVHLAQEMGDVMGTEGASGEGLSQGRGDLFGTVSASDLQQFVKFTEERAVRVSQAAEISFHGFLWTHAPQ